jgi:hypothetical protein
MFQENEGDSEGKGGGGGEGYLPEESGGHHGTHQGGALCLLRSDQNVKFTVYNSIPVLNNPFVQQCFQICVCCHIFRRVQFKNDACVFVVFFPTEI